MTAAQRKQRTPPKGYEFTDETHRWYWRPVPHYHVIESEFGDIDGRCFISEEQAKRVLWRAFQKDYDIEAVAEYTHRPKDGDLDIRYEDGKELHLGLFVCQDLDDCYMVREAE